MTDKDKLEFQLALEEFIELSCPEYGYQLDRWSELRDLLFYYIKSFDSTGTPSEDEIKDLS